MPHVASASSPFPLVPCRPSHPLPRRHEPHSVERYPSIGGVTLIGFDDGGLPVVEVTVVDRLFADAFAEKMALWLRASCPGAHDQAAD